VTIGRTRHRVEPLTRQHTPKTTRGGRALPAWHTLATVAQRASPSHPVGTASAAASTAPGGYVLSLHDAPRSAAAALDAVTSATSAVLTSTVVRSELTSAMREVR
jgi:hypothetical protein